MLQEPGFKICSAEDIPQIVAICRQSYIEHYTYLWHDHGENYMQASFTPERILSEMKVAESQFYLIYDGVSPAGILKLNIGKATDGTENENYLEIERLYFLKAAAGKGFGKSTLAMVMQLAITENKKFIWLKAMKGADAVKFYEKQGFVIAGETELSYPFIKDEFKAMVVMLLAIQ